jgi:hypothetical protein
MARMLISAGALGTCLAVALLAGCAGGGTSSSASTAAGSTSTTAPTTTTTTTPTTTAPAPPPAGPPFGVAPVAGAARGGGLALLTDVRVGGHEGFDRIVFEFRSGASPGYRVRYVRPPIIEDPSGRTVRIAGTAFLSVRMEPASRFDLAGSAGQVYKGPSRISGASAGSDVVEEVVLTGDFEAVMNWTIGLKEKAPFRVLRLSNPARLVVDLETVG